MRRLDRDRGLHARGRERAVEQIAGRRAGRRRDQRQPRQFRDRQPPLARELGIGRAHRDDLLPFEPQGDERVVTGWELGQAQLALTDRDAPLERGVVLGVGDVHGHARVRGSEPPDQARERLRDQRRQRHQVESAAPELAHRGHRVERGVAITEELARGTEQRLARGREPHRAPRPLEQVHVELSLQPVHSF